MTKAQSLTAGSNYLTLSDHLKDLRNYKTPWERLVRDVVKASSQKSKRCTLPSRKSQSDKGRSTKNLLAPQKWKEVEAHLRALYSIGPYEVAFKMDASYPTLKNWRKNGISLDKYGDRLKELGIDYELLI